MVLTHYIDFNYAIITYIELCRNGRICCGFSGDHQLPKGFVVRLALPQFLIAHCYLSGCFIRTSEIFGMSTSVQVLTALRVICGKDGTNIGQAKIDALRNNSNYFRSEMERIGVSVVGDYDSPVVPVLVYFPAKISAFSRECLKRGLAVVVVGFPATSVIMSRARFCISAGHTKEDLDFAVKVIEEVAGLVMLKYEKSILGC